MRGIRDLKIMARIRDSSGYTRYRAKDRVEEVIKSSRYKKEGDVKEENEKCHNLHLEVVL